jgi:hypothetical protein
MIRTDNRGLQLQTMAEAERLGTMISKSVFVPKDFKGKPAECVLAIQFGAEIGFGPMQSVQSIAVINGRPSIYGDAAIALAHASSVCEYIEEKVEGEGEQMVATCIAKRRGNPKPVVVSFSVADAKKAKLWGKSGPWSEYPRRMMQMRARGFALRDAFPDVLRGLVTAEEATDYSLPGISQTSRPDVQKAEIEIRPAFPKAEPEAEQHRTDKALQMVGDAKTPEELDHYSRVVDTKLKNGEWEDYEADEVKKQIHAKWEAMSSVNS